MVDLKEEGLQPKLPAEVLPAGAVTDAAQVTANFVAEKNINDSDAPSSSSNGLEPKTEEATVAPRRSKGKTLLIMSALCVSFKCLLGNMIPLLKPFPRLLSFLPRLTR